ncbi:MAG TPA: hypothetical protein VJI15_05585 [Candidatus Nanoarchaeia archaeon]|nr:hypothetical protein [Candidatus Nanoarchaeia archaeon]
MKYIQIGKPPKGKNAPPAWARKLLSMSAVPSQPQSNQLGSLQKLVTEGGLPGNQQLLKKPLIDRLKDTGYLLKHSFKVFGKETDLFKPLIRMALFSLLEFVPLFLFLYFFFSLKIGLVFLLFFLFAPFYIIYGVYGVFFYIRQQADQSWLTYNVITGKNISYQEAREHTAKLKPSFRWIAVINLFVAGVSAKKGGQGQIARILFSLLEEVWDLVGNFMIPAVVITKKSWKDTIPDLKALKRNVPATLVGVFGIDFAGNILKVLVRYLVPFFLLLGLWIGTFDVFISNYPHTVIKMFGFSFSLVPLFFTFFIDKILSTFVGVLVRSTKTIYYTIFYTAVLQPKKLSPDIKKEVTRYLKFE